MTSKKSLILFLFTFFICSLVLPEMLMSGTNEITGINVEEVGACTEIRIDGSSQFSYTMYKPEDPYSAVVELHGVDLGKFKDKIVFDKAGVMEIIPSISEVDKTTVRLEIVFSIPAEIEPIQKESGLVLKFHNPESEEAIAATEKEPTVLAKDETGKEESKESPAKAASMIENVEFVKSADRVNVLISADGQMSPKVSRIDSNKLVIDIPNVATMVESVKTYEPPVLGIRIGEYLDKTSIVFDIADSTKYDVTTGEKQIVVSFEKPAAKTQVAKSEPPAKVEAPFAKPEAGAFTSKEYTGEKISLDFQDADLIHIFRLLADVSGYNIVVSPEVKGKFSMKLIDVPWDQALDIILRNYGLSRTVDGNIIRIAPTNQLAQEEEEIAKAKEASEKAGDLVTRVYPINYANVDQVKKVITDAKILSKRGYVSIDGRTSTVVLKDVENTHKEFERVMKSIDLATPQVNIEAKIVEVTTNFTRQLGVQWGALWKPPDSRTTFGGPSIPGGTGFNSGNPLMVNLPASVSSGVGGALGIGFISASQTIVLDLQLSAMESSGNGKIISNPKITTSDNQEAYIKQGKKIPYQTTSAEGTKTEFVDANLELTVTPHITPEGTIVMNLEAKKNEADFSQTVGGVPTIDTKEAKTQVIVKNGDTLVIGGIFKTKKSDSLAAVPGFSKIPLIGWLFKNKLNKDETSELLIFITPKVIKGM